MSKQNSATDTDPKRVSIDMDQISSFCKFFVILHKLLLLVSCDASFRSTTGHMSSPIQYQVMLKPGLESPPMPLEFSRIEIHFSDSKHDQMVKGCRDRDRSKIHFIDAKNSSFTQDENMKCVEGDLLLNRTGEIWIEGQLEAKQPGEIKIIYVSAFIRESEYELELQFKVGDRPLTKLTPSWLKINEDEDGKLSQTILYLNTALNHTSLKYSCPRTRMLLIYVE